jgi:hypothetical protein
MYLPTGVANVTVRCPFFAAKLGGVAEPSSWDVPARHPDRLIKWFIGVVVLGVGVNLLSGFVLEQKWAALLVAVLCTGLLRRERYDTARARTMALLCPRC